MISHLPSPLEQPPRVQQMPRPPLRRLGVRLQLRVQRSQEIGHWQGVAAPSAGNEIGAEDKVRSQLPVGLVYLVYEAGPVELEVSPQASVLAEFQGDQLPPLVAADHLHDVEVPAEFIENLQKKTIYAFIISCYNFMEFSLNKKQDNAIRLMLAEI